MHANKRAAWLRETSLRQEEEKRRKAEKEAEALTVAILEAPSPKKKRAATSKSQQSDSSSDGNEDDPVNNRREKLLATLLSYGVRPDAPDKCRTPQEKAFTAKALARPRPQDPSAMSDHVAIMANIFRTIVGRMPGLVERARVYPDVPSFVRSVELSLFDLEKLRKKLRREGAVSALVIRNAIADLYRDPDEVPKDEKQWLLGGWLYDKPSEKPMPREGWEFFHDFVSR